MSLLTSTPPDARYTLRALAHLLRYPDRDLSSHLHELREALHAEGALRGARLAELDILIERLNTAPPLVVQADYVEIFDRGRHTSLHLFEHVHGDSRDRGQAMIDLGQTYAAAGLRFAADELPDYLPVVLEFASTQPPTEARAFLREFAHILRAIFSALQRRRSRYASVLGALLELAGEKVETIALPDEPTLDETWEEPAAFDGCGRTGQDRRDAVQPLHFVPRDAADGIKRGQV